MMKKTLLWALVAFGFVGSQLFAQRRGGYQRTLNRAQIDRIHPLLTRRRAPGMSPGPIGQLPLSTTPEPAVPITRPSRFVRTYPGQTPPIVGRWGNATQYRNNLRQRTQQMEAQNLAVDIQDM